MKKTILTPLAIIIIIVFVVFVGGTAIWQYLEILKEKTPVLKLGEKSKKLEEIKNPELNVREQLAKCAEVTEFPIIKKIKCYKNIFKKREYSEELCENINREERDACYFGAALAKKDKTLCRKVIGTSGFCYTPASLEREKNKSLCRDRGILNYTGGLTAAAQRRVSSGLAEELVSLDKSDCETLVDSTELSFEDQMAQGNFLFLFDSDLFNKGDYNYNESLCEKVSVQESRYECYMMMALARENETLCEKAGEAKKVCYAEVAVAKKDETLCEKTGEIREPCYEAVAMAKADENLCKKTGEEEIDFCNMYVATIKKDEVLCEKIRSEYLRNVCYMDIAKAKKDESICERAEDRASCYTELAIIKNAETLCEKAEELKGRCYEGLAEINGDETICEKAGDDRGICYYYLATTEEKRSLCEKADQLKSRCYDYFKHTLRF